MNKFFFFLRLQFPVGFDFLDYFTTFSSMSSTFLPVSNFHHLQILYACHSSFSWTLLKSSFGMFPFRDVLRISLFIHPKYVSNHLILCGFVMLAIFAFWISALSSKFVCIFHVAPSSCTGLNIFLNSFRLNHFRPSSFFSSYAEFMSRRT